MRMRRVLACWPLALGMALACASAPAPPAPGTAQAFGVLRLVPPAGAEAGGGADAYGDRRLRDVEFVDYSKPGFAVVYVEDAEPPAGVLDLTLRTTRVGTRLDPSKAAVGAGGRVTVRNATDEAHVLSYPAAGVVHKLEPGQALELAVARAGEQGLYLLDVPDSEATLFAAPGSFSVVSAAGRFTLRDLRPGTRVLRVWHPRFPPARREVELAPDASLEVDFDLGTGRKQHSHAH